jgi:hypothetical protein
LDGLCLEKNEWYANEPGLSLRSGPSTEYNKIVTLKETYLVLKPNIERKGKNGECKVEMTQYRKTSCTGEDNLIIKHIQVGLSLYQKKTHLMCGIIVKVGKKQNINHAICITKKH